MSENSLVFFMSESTGLQAMERFEETPKYAQLTAILKEVEDVEKDP